MIATRPATPRPLVSILRDLIVAGVAAAPIAALLTIALHGRTTLRGLSLQWATTFAIIALITVAWAILARAWNRHGTFDPTTVLGVIPGIWRGLAPAATVAAVATVATYASDDLFHALAHEPRLAGTLLPGTDRKSTRLNSSHEWISRMPSSA